MYQKITVVGVQKKKNGCSSGGGIYENARAGICDSTFVPHNHFG